MTPKEKADELVRKYWGKGITNYKGTAKQCALIAVEEVLNKDGYNNDYWKEVKAEIEKL